MSGGNGSTPLSPFAELKRQLLEQRQLVADRLAALEQAEQAFEQLAAAFSSPPERHSASCEHCSATFEPRQKAGHPQRFCSKTCRQKSHALRRKAKAASEAAARDPFPDQEPAIPAP